MASFVSLSALVSEIFMIQGGWGVVSAPSKRLPVQNTEYLACDNDDRVVLSKKRIYTIYR